MSSKKDAQLKLKDMGAKLLGPERDAYWRSLDQLAQTDEFKKWVGDEFPERESLLSLDRRHFVKLMGASMLMASLAGCRQLPQEKIVPFVKPPEGERPGVGTPYATMVPFMGYAMGALAISTDGRPTKVDGHPSHPSTLGASSVHLQAALYDLYDPDRAQSVEQGNLVSNWEEFARAVRGKLHQPGARARILTEALTSPTEVRLINEFLAKHPGSQWHVYQPFGDANVTAGCRQAFGRAVQPVYHFDRAEVVLSLDADFLHHGPAAVRHCKDFSARRRVEGENPSMSRLYCLHSEATVTSAAADHALAVKPSKLRQYAAALQMLLEGSSAAGAEGDATAWLGAVASDLAAHRGHCVVVAGDHLPAEMHAFAAWCNATLGNVGRTVDYVERLTVGDEDPVASLTELVDAMRGGQVDVLIVLHANPVFTAPTELNFAEAMREVPFTARLGLHHDETSALCTWRLPAAHSLESWGDGRAHDGTITLQQPLIAPLYNGRSSIELLSMLEDIRLSGLELVRETHLGRASGNLKTFERWIHDGMIPNTAAPGIPFSTAQAPSLSGEASKELELVVLPDPNILDGRYANNPWLQELPRPMTSTTWDNAVIMSPATGARFGLNGTNNGTWVQVEAGGASVRGMSLIVPGTADDTVVVHAGFGRRAGGSVATGQSHALPEQRHPLKPKGDQVGFDVYPLLRPGGTVGAPVSVSLAGGAGRLAVVQFHHQMEGRDIVRSGTLADYKKDPNLRPPHHHEPADASLYNLTEREGEGQYQWAMTIDLSLCTGCNACTIACQAENSIPAVGKEQVLRGREMHWIRVDRYYKGDPAHPEETLFQPVPCMHCEKAPCEPVCPVAATVHSKEGLNQMVYNRCVGTRYCSNNCPYKVRRFNFLNYGDKVDKPSLLLLNNPEVTVRGRGVMEKCTYCVQRISKARIQAKKEGRRIRDGEIKTACQIACPSNAIVFGDKSDPTSAVSKSRANPRNYLLLEELNTTPRTTYLGRVRNPHPELASTKPSAEEHEAH